MAILVVELQDLETVRCPRCEDIMVFKDIVFRPIHFLPNIYRCYEILECPTCKQTAVVQYIRQFKGLNCDEQSIRSFCKTLGKLVDTLSNLQDKLKALIEHLEVSSE